MFFKFLPLANEALIFALDNLGACLSQDFLGVTAGYFVMLRGNAGYVSPQRD
jgi:hypothetical protein